MKATSRGGSSVGRARPSQGRGRGFEPRLPLHNLPSHFVFSLEFTSSLIDFVKDRVILFNMEFVARPVRNSFFVLFFSLVSASVWGLGEISLDTSAFFLDDPGTSNVFSILNLRPQYRLENSKVEVGVEARGVVLTTDPRLFTADVVDLYVGTGSALSERHQFSFGRKYVDWSKVDSEWKLGTWSPRLSVNAFDQELLGLTGFFYEFRSKHVDLISHASFIAIPEFGFPCGDKDYNPNRFCSPMPSSFSIQDITVPIQININMPSYASVLLRPSAAMKLRFHGESGWWVEPSYGYLQVHQTNAALQVQVATPDTARAEVVAYPIFPGHHLLSLQGGMNQKYYDLWASLSGEIPNQPTVASDLVWDPLGKTLFFTFGGGLHLLDGLHVSVSHLTVSEEQINRPSPLPIEFSIGERFLYRSAWRVGARWENNNPVSYGATLTRDSRNQSNRINLALTIDLAKFSRLRNTLYSGWKFGFSADILTTSTGDGTIGSKADEDRFRTIVAYSF